MLQKVLITGASGNIGQAIKAAYKPNDTQFWKWASRKPTKGNEVYFDFGDLPGSKPALEQCDVLFLLRPPQLADVKRYFVPLVEVCVEADVKHVVFLSVQGADKASFIPHAKIEKLLRGSTLHYTFLRPSYFMQNLTTTLLHDIKQQNRIYLPAGKTPFLWIDVADIGLAAAKVLQAPEKHQNAIYTLTGKNYWHFGQVAQKLSQTLDRTIQYKSPSVLSFWWNKRKAGVVNGYIMVMLLLHYLPRFQALPPITHDLEELTGIQPGSLDAFIKNHRESWE